MRMSILHKMGLRREHLTPVSKRILAANDEEVRVLGAIFVKVSGIGTRGQHTETSAMVYVTESTKRFSSTSARARWCNSVCWDQTSHASVPRWRQPRALKPAGKALTS